MINNLRRKTTSYKQCFETESGKVVLKDLMKLCKYTDPTFVAGDTHSTAYYEGMRRVMIYIMNLVTKDADDLEQILKIKNGDI